MSTTSPAFRERLLPGAGALATAVAAGLLALVVLLPLHPPSAVVVGVAVAAAGITWLVAGAPVLAVDDGVLHAGRAHVPVELLGEATPLTTREQMRAELGGRLDARAHVVLRSWIPTGVRVVLRDPADPTPYWLLSTRRPEELAAALHHDAGAGPGAAKAATPAG
ncbi:hypothetical protein Xcel_1923 [Xylanimonas cellulosilytica DSM 15894]|uniref:DUF3093 domain-containing protein n=1 Tax=Xylanimonas cellulosilytica (strain DSM 15894 / JCM 12276 / CECT 5975 / KCTC 9989 / LMG 20990 / NBRC 107835 / XIL07) TaxID=446471 RepID=D1BTG3_XYLCX|nr:DUF3093 domain-containing protein [Xylanimonas cellulosilytica]ACZ30942.1 hypothetical protein Xcel_1923 [Xylanimonas cellulosilytica DSM 15894]